MNTWNEASDAGHPGRLVGTVGHEVATVHTDLGERVGWSVRAPIDTTFTRDMSAPRLWLVNPCDEEGEGSEGVETVLMGFEDLTLLLWKGEPLGEARLAAWPRVEEAGMLTGMGDEEAQLPLGGTPGPLTRGQARMAVRARVESATADEPMTSGDDNRVLEAIAVAGGRPLAQRTEEALMPAAESGIEVAMDDEVVKIESVARAFDDAREVAEKKQRPSAHGEHLPASAESRSEDAREGVHHERC